MTSKSIEYDDENDGAVTQAGDPNAQVVREIARKHIRSGHTDIGLTLIDHFGNGVLDDEEYDAWERAVRPVWRTELHTLSWPVEQPQEFECEVCTKPITAYPCVLCEHEPDPWKKAAEQSQDGGDVRELAWHELRRFSGPAFLDEGDVDQHELTHPEQCSTLPPGAVCWAEHQPFRWWWPTAHGIYRIRPEDLLTGGSEDGPDYQTTLRVQVLKDGEWFEYTNDIIGADPTDETPRILERLKAGLAGKAEADDAARADRDDPFAMIAEDAPAGPAYAVAEHWFSHAALISDSVGGLEWHAIASLTRRILDLMDEEQNEAVQAVAEAVSILEGMLNEDAWAYDAGRARNVLLDCFARELDALEARDAKAGDSDG